MAQGDEGPRVVFGNLLKSSWVLLLLFFFDKVFFHIFSRVFGRCSFSFHHV